MSREEITAKIAEAVVSGLERLAFIFAFHTEDKADISDSTRASVSFKGRFNGRMILAMPTSALPELAGNMLGLDADTPPIEKQYDALGETANVLCGNILPILAEETAVYDIDAPKILGSSEPDPEEGPSCLKVFFQLEQGYCSVSLIVEDHIF